MTHSDIAQQRLLSQHIARPTFSKPEDVVASLGAVQAQDFAGAKWALGLRLQGATDDDLDRAFADGSILRTHLLRPTWHFITPADIHWMLALTAPRVHVVNASMYRKLELDDATFTRSHTALSDALSGGKQRTRAELGGVLQKAGIAAADGFRLAYIMMHAELEGLICSGARRGKQFTYTLLDDRAPHARMLDHEEALAELAGRYFMSRGPATVQDFAKWSGLTVTDARKGLEAVESRLLHEVVDGQSYWLSASEPVAEPVSPGAYLLSIYDEYVSGYKDRSAIVDDGHAAKLQAMGNALNYIIVVDGRIVGAWKRTVKRGAVVLETNVFTRLTKAENRAVTAAAQQYGTFLGLPVARA